MTDEKTIPPWLEETNTKQGGGLYSLNWTPEWRQLHEFMSESYEDVPSWLAWRSRVGAALGLVDPNVMTLEDWRARMGFTGADAAARDRAIAAELRRLADKCRRLPGKQGNSMADLDEPATAYEAAALLRARADELDPRGG